MQKEATDKGRKHLTEEQSKYYIRLFLKNITNEKEG